jgi:hypothetical protein
MPFHQMFASAILSPCPTEITLCRPGCIEFSWPLKWQAKNSSPLRFSEGPNARQSRLLHQHHSIAPNAFPAAGVFVYERASS